MDMNVSDEMVRLQILKRIFSDRINSEPDQKIQIGVESMDDAALIKISSTESLVIASDFIRGSGFYLFQMGYLNYFDMGYYLIAANISDIAAMGATPLALTTIFRYTDHVSDEEFQSCFEGMKAAAKFYRVEIIGGDIGGHTADVFAATAIGLVHTEKALLRKNVGDTDLLCVTGEIGRAITALTYFKKVKLLGFELNSGEEEDLLKAWRRPVARVAEGLLLSENRLATACQDVSDGLKSTIEQLSSISGKTFTVYADRLPINEATKRMASFLDIEPTRIAISASNDFELAFTISREKEKICKQLFDENGRRLTVIGEVNSEGKNLWVNERGEKTGLPGVSWKQQTDDYLSKIISR